MVMVEVSENVDWVAECSVMEEDGAGEAVASVIAMEPIDDADAIQLLPEGTVATKNNRKREPKKGTKKLLL